MLKRYQVGKQECQVPSCSADGYVTLIDPLGKDRSEDVDQDSINAEEIYFLCRYHVGMYGRYTRDELNTMDEIDPSFKELLNIPTINIEELLSTGEPRPQTDQALRQQNYRTFRQYNIDYKDLQCMVEDCIDKAHIHIPDFNNHREIQPVCNYHKGKTDETIDIRTISGIKRLKQLKLAMKSLKSSISKLENTEKQSNVSKRGD